MDSGQRAIDEGAAVRDPHRVIAATVRMLERHWKETQPDMVVSFVPHFNRALYESFNNAYPGRPFVTVLTDIADYPPHFWIERQQQYLVCGSDRAVAQAREHGPLGRSYISRVGDDPASALLRAAHTKIPSRSACVWGCARICPPRSFYSADMARK